MANTHYFKIEGHLKLEEISKVIRELANEIDNGNHHTLEGTPGDFFMMKIIPSDEQDDVHEAKEFIRFQEHMDKFGTSEGFSEEID